MDSWRWAAATPLRGAERDGVMEILMTVTSVQGHAEMIEYGELRPSYVDVEVVAESTLGEIRFFSGLHASPRIGQHITVTITTPEAQ